MKNEPDHRAPDAGLLRLARIAAGDEGLVELERERAFGCELVDPGELLVADSGRSASGIVRSMCPFCSRSTASLASSQRSSVVPISVGFAVTRCCRSNARAAAHQARELARRRAPFDLGKFRLERRADQRLVVRGVQIVGLARCRPDR